ncbi:hypothetical protein D3C87_963260 [compost metagenome]
MALRLIGFIIVVLVLWFFITQVVIPLVRARPPFPAFRGSDKDVKKLKEEVELLQQQVDVLNDVNELAAAKKKLVRAKAKLEAASVEHNQQ